MIEFSEEEKNKINEFKNTVPMSFQMERELMGLCSYLYVNQMSVSKYLDEFLKENVMPGETIKKNRSKVLLETMRENIIKNIDVNPIAKNNDFPKNEKITAWVEESVKDDPLTQELIKNADEVVFIKHYKDIFNAKGHDFKAEKYSRNFIVARNTETLIYPGAPFCQSFGNENFYYASCVKNCIYDCDYCFLQGMYPSGLPVYFVNLDDYFSELDRILKEKPVYLCVSYDTDLLALENRIHYVDKWISYSQFNKNLKVEIRTKCGNNAFFSDYDLKVKSGFAEKCDNVIFGWTISPDFVARHFEKGLPSTEARINAAKSAIKAGFKVRLCFDPMIYHKDYKNSYRELFTRVFDEISPSDLLDVSVGVFRISNNLLKNMRDVNPLSPVTCFPYITENGACHYGKLSHEMVGFAANELKKYLPTEKIFIWDGN